MGSPACRKAYGRRRLPPGLSERRRHEGKPREAGWREGGHLQEDVSRARGVAAGAHRMLVAGCALGSGSATTICGPKRERGCARSVLVRDTGECVLKGGSQRRYIRSLVWWGSPVVAVSLTEQRLRWLSSLVVDPALRFNILSYAHAALYVGDTRWRRKTPNIEAKNTDATDEAISVIRA